MLSNAVQTVTVGDKAETTTFTDLNSHEVGELYKTMQAVLKDMNDLIFTRHEKHVNTDPRVCVRYQLEVTGNYQTKSDESAELPTADVELIVKSLEKHSKALHPEVAKKGKKVKAA